MLLLPLLLACETAPEGDYALSFDGAPDCASIDLDEAPPASFTTDVWLRGDPEAFDALRPIVMWSQVFTLQQTADGQLLFTVGTENTGASYGFGVLDGVLHHVSAVYDGADGAMRLFVDGDFVASGATAAFVGEQPDDRIQVGCAKAATEGFYGVIDELRISSVARQVDDFELPSAPYEKDADTWMLFHLDEGAGETAASATGDYEMRITDVEWTEFSIRSAE
jgi:hypothetical protein